MLDAGFGNAGKVTINFGAASADSANAVAIQADGNIVVAGSSDVNAPGNFDAAVARLTPAAGALDAAFGAGGKATVDFGGVADTINDMAIQTDGNLLFVGTNDADAVVARLSQTNGALDPSFNGTGKAVINVNGLESGNGIDLMANGRIVITGTTNGGVDGFVSRLIGTVEKGQRLGVSGPPNGTAQPYTPTFTTGQYSTAPGLILSTVGPVTTNVRTAVADVNGDFIPDTIVVTGFGTPIRVTVISGVDDKTQLVSPFDPFGGDFVGGGFVAAADVDGDGRAEFVVTPDQGGGPRVSIFRWNADGTTTILANFFGIDDVNFRGGARAALGDVNADGVNDLAVAAGFLGGPRTALFDGKTLLTTPTRLVNDFFAFPGSDAVTLRNGVFVSIGDVTGDGFADLIFGGGPGGAPRVFVLSGALVAANNVAGAQAAPIANFFVAGNSSDRGGVRVAATDADGDNKAEVAVGSGEGVASRVRVYLGKNFTTASEPATFQDLDPFGATLPGGVFVG
ncbi:VCBS repeat-containing protein [bacterium]|nr:VCBS repeat-containing protein [bacterium]